MDFGEEPARCNHSIEMVRFFLDRSPRHGWKNHMFPPKFTIAPRSTVIAKVLHVGR